MPDVHKGSLETYKLIADAYIHSQFPYSLTDVWHRMGFLGPFGHYVLSSMEGHILEIGAGESSVYLAQLARIFGRKIIHCDLQGSVLLNALTVKGYFCEDTAVLTCGQKPFDTEHKSLLYIGPSDNLFQDILLPPLALAFIDGDHSYEQVKKDFYNVLPYVVDNGFILLHDTYPRNEEWTTATTCGTVYKLRQELEMDTTLDCITLVRGTAMDFGLTIVRKKPKNLPYYRA